MRGLTQPRSANQCLRFFLGLASLLFTPYSSANNSWTLEFTPQLWYGNYQDSLTRDSILSYGFFTSADYLERGGFAFGYNRSDVTGKTVVDDIIGPDIEESAVFLSAYYTTFPDALPGKLSIRVDGYSVNDKNTVTQITVISGGSMGGSDRVITESTAFTDKIVAGLTQLSFMDYGENYYLDIGYAFSSYNYDTNDLSQDNEVQQITPTVGIALNEQYDWLQARAYFIRLKHGINTNNQTSSNAVELQWTHWFDQQALLGLHSIGINTVIGERISAVDPEAGEIYSFSDRENSSLSLLMSWQTNKQTQVTIIVGHDQYTDFLANESDIYTEDDYSITYGYLNLSIQW